MRERAVAAFEAFLVEDVILTLANLRASLGWLAADAATPDLHRAGLERIGRQIGLIEDRARAVCGAGLADPAPVGDRTPAVFRSRRS